MPVVLQPVVAGVAVPLAVPNLVTLEGVTERALCGMFYDELHFQVTDIKKHPVHVAHMLGIPILLVHYWLAERPTSLGDTASLTVAHLRVFIQALRCQRGDL